MTRKHLLNQMLAFACMLALSACSGKPATVSKQCFHVNAEMEQSIGYCSAVRSGNQLQVSGVTASGEMSAATTAVYQRLERVLKSHGLSFANVIKENVYTTKLDDFIATAPIRKTFYGNEFPAATWVQVDRLFMPSMVLEVELIAVFPD